MLAHLKDERDGNPSARGSVDSKTECKRKSKRVAWIEDSTKRRQTYTKRGDGIQKKIRDHVTMTGCSNMFISVSENYTVHFSGTGDFLDLAMSKFLRKYLLQKFSQTGEKRDKTFVSFSTKIQKVGKDLRTEHIMNSTIDHDTLDHQRAARGWDKPQVFGCGTKTVNSSYFDGVNGHYSDNNNNNNNESESEDSTYDLDSCEENKSRTHSSDASEDNDTKS